MAAVKLVSLTKEYQNGENYIRAVDDVSFSIKEGEFIAVIGASGSGKSLTLKSIAGIEHPDQGHIQIGDHVLYDSDSRICLKPQKRNVGYMFQNYALFPTMTVEQNVLCGLKAEKDPTARRAACAEMLRAMRLETLAKRYPAQLSGGQQQRAAIARALITRPAVVLADEPTGNLDHQNSVEVFRLLREAAAQQHQTVVYVTHDQGLAAQADRVLRMQDGRIEEA